MTARYSELFAIKLAEKFPAVNSYDVTYTISMGRKFDKILGRWGVYAFVNIETGELIKAASWSAPAMNKNKQTAGKYFLNTEEGFEIALFNADRSGGFLYMDYPVKLPA